ncbi:homeobox protein 2-like isoform X2 [Cotesia glomerata]|uniref:Uncharacterized protein n=1 Tax=Cotesia glomerata TaxID=32391 RepID=A0AAV7J6Y2_COTGL|nr:homeobox protein 2-like isoform X2 [Cotesia glomerata]KAH0568575.1 hypothetical protein KQX54_021227 [Cotesia glomerata]
MEKWRCRGKNTGAKVKVTEENAAPQKPSTESQPEKKKEKKWTFAGLLKRKSKQTASSEQSNSLLSLTPNPTIYYSEQVKNVQTNPSKADRDKSHNNYNKQTTGNATKKHESTDSMNFSNASTSAVVPPATIQSRNSESSDTGSKYSRRNRLKARIQAKRDRYYGDSSTDDEHSHYKSSNNSNSNCYINTNSIVNGNANITATAAAATNPNNSLMRIQSEDSIYHHHHHHHHHNNNNYHRRLIEANKKTRGARTVRYMKRFYRDDTIDDHDGNIDVRIHPIYHHVSPVLQSHSNNYNYNYNNNSNNGIVKKKADTLPSTNNLWTTTNNHNLLLKPPYYQAFCSEQNLLHVYPNNYNDNIKYQSDNLHGLNDNEVFNNEYAWPQPHEAKLTTATSNYNKSRGINCHVDNKSPPPPAPASSSVSPASASVLAPQPPPRSTSVSHLHPVASARHSHHLDLDIFTETNSCSGCSHNHHNHNHSCSQQLLPCGSNVNYNSLDRIYATPKRRDRCCNRRVVRHPISEPFLLYKNNNSSSINNNNNNNNTFSKKSHEVEDKMPEDPIVPKIKKKIVPKMKGYKSIYEQPLEKRRHSKNLEEALIELETIYNSLHLNEDEDLLDRAEQRSMEEYRDKIAITAAAKAGIGGSIKSSLDTSSSSSPSPSPSAASSYELNLWRNVNFDRHDNYSNNHNHNNSHSHNNNNNNNNNNNDDEPRLKDDMAYRRMHQPERSASVDPSQSSLSRVSYLAASPSLLSYKDREYQIDNNYLLGNYVNVSCNNEKPKNQRRGTPDLTRDDVAYRNITHANNTLRVIEPQPPFGIPLGPVTAAAESDYLHVEPKIKHTRSSLYIPKNEPDIVTDDLAFRNLRKDTNGKNKFANSMNNISFVPTRESMSRSILAGNCDLKKKRAVRSLSADLYGIIDKSNDDHHAWYKEFTKVNSSKLFPQDGPLISSSSVGDISIRNYNNNNDDNFYGKDKNSDLDINGNRPKSLYQAKIQVCVPHEEDGKVLRRQSCEREFMEMENCQTFDKKSRTLSSPYYGGGSFDVDVDEDNGGGGEVVDTNEKVIEPSSDQELSEYKQLCRNLESLIKKTSEKVKKSVEEAKSNPMLLGSNRNSLSEFIEWEELLGEDESLKINKKVIEDEEDGKAKGEGKGNEVKEKIRMDKEELEKMIKEIKDDTKSEYKEPDQLLKLNIDDETGTKVIDTEASCESYNSNKESLKSVVKLVPSNDAQNNISSDDYDNSHVDYHACNNDVDCDDDKQPNAEEFHLDKQVPYLSCDSTKLNDDNNFDNDFKNLISSDSHTNIDDGVDVAATGDDKKEPALKQPETADPNPSELEVHAGQKDDTEKTCRGRETTL